MHFIARSFGNLLGMHRPFDSFLLSWHPMFRHIPCNKDRTGGNTHLLHLSTTIILSSVMSTTMILSSVMSC